MAADIYAVVGHGNEEPVPFEERTRVPPGYTVVLLANPGRPVSVTNAETLWKRMYSEPELFADPIGNKEMIKRIGDEESHIAGNFDVRIYREGMPLPAMRINPQSYFTDNTGISMGKILIGGIYKFPLRFPSLEMNSQRVFGSSTIINVDQLYSGDANRQIREDILRIGSYVDAVRDENRFSYTIEHILAMNGPGIYYFLNCRYIKGLEHRLKIFLNQLLGVIGRERNILDSRLRESLKSLPNESKREKKQIYIKYSMLIGSGIQNLLNRLEEIRTAGNMLPEEKLPYLRNVLLEGTFMEGNDLLEGREPISEEEIQDYIQRFTALTNHREGLNIRPEKAKLVLSPMRRRLVAMFDGEFGSLLERLPVTRQRSAAGQAIYSGGKRKTRRGKKKGTRRRRV